TTRGLNILGSPLHAHAAVVKEANALAIFNGVSWETLRGFVSLALVAAGRGAMGSSSVDALARWRCAEGWHYAFTKADAHLGGGVVEDGDPQAGPCCPVARALVKSKLGWLSVCLGRLNPAADNAEEVLSILETYPGAIRGPMWKHPLHLAAGIFKVSGRRLANHRLQRIYNTFRLPDEAEWDPCLSESSKMGQECPTCKTTCSLLAEAYPSKHQQPA
ncbi:unnamed protein product, partial [Discosporangium mesarthrocarpum]